MPLPEHLEVITVVMAELTSSKPQGTKAYPSIAINGEIQVYTTADSRLTLEELCENTPPSKENLWITAKRIMDVLDKNRDGYIDAEEIALALHAVKFKSPDTFRKIMSADRVVQMSDLVGAIQAVRLSVADIEKIRSELPLAVRIESIERDV